MISSQYITLENKILEKELELDKIQKTTRHLLMVDYEFQKDKYLINGGCQLCFGGKIKLNILKMKEKCNCFAEGFTYEPDLKMFESLDQKKEIIEKQIKYLKNQMEIKNSDLIITTKRGYKNSIGIIGKIFSLKVIKNYILIGFCDDEGQKYWDYIKNVDKIYSEFINTNMPIS
jgi:hypothetical protein